MSLDLACLCRWKETRTLLDIFIDDRAVDLEVLLEI